jgi:hypothetical protein
MRQKSPVPDYQFSSFILLRIKKVLFFVKTLELLISSKTNQSRQKMAMCKQSFY